MGSTYSNIAIKSIASSNSSVSVPTVSTVALTSSIGALNNTLNTNDIVYATVTFSEAVEITGVVGSTPLLTLTIGVSPVSATYYSGSRTTQIVFAYTILSGQNDANGISIGANSITFNGGSIKSLSGVTATITHSAVTDNPTYLVDTTSPTISSIGITSITGISNGYGNAGDIVNATVVFTKNITVTGSPTLALNIGGTSVISAYSSGSGTSSLVFTYTILSGQNDSNGISIDANSVSLNGGTLVDSVGNTATITHSAVTDNASYKVDTLQPYVTNVALTGASGSQNNLLNAGDIVTASVTFSEIVTVTGSPYIAIIIGASAVNAGYSSGSNSTTLTFTYTILSGQTDVNGISINASSISLNGGSITDLAGNPATTTHSAVTDNSTYQVDTTSPTVSSVAFGTTSGTLNSILNTGDTVQINVVFTETVTVSSGTPYIAITIGASAVNAGYISGSGTSQLVFQYTILAGQNDSNGISIAANSLASNGATIVDLAGNTAVLTHNAVTDNASYVVDTSASTPTLTSGSFTTLDNATVTMQEAGTVYLVNTSVSVTNEASVLAAADANWNSVTVLANTATSLPLTGLNSGTYRAWGVDLAGNFSTGAPSANSITVSNTIIPVAGSYTPQLGATGVLVTSTIQITFQTPIQRGTGNIELRVGSSTGLLIESFIAASSNRIAISGVTFTLSPTSSLSYYSTYFVVFPSGCIQSTTSGNWAGTSSYFFTTAIATGAPAGRWLVAGSNGNILSSSDNGVTWNFVGSAGNWLNGVITGAAIAGGVIVIVGNNSGNTTTTSFSYTGDFLNWNAVNLLQSAEYTSVAYGNGVWAMASQTGQIVILSSFTGSTATTNGSGYNNVGFCEASQYFFLQTTNGIFRFTGVDAPSLVQVYTASNVLTYAVGGPGIRNNTIMFALQYGILRSADGGATWTLITTPVTISGSADCRGVAWVTGTVWIAIIYSSAASTNYCYSSDDGATWSILSGGPNISWWSCVGSNGVNGAMVRDIGIQSGNCYWTPDGINWSTGTSSSQPYAAKLLAYIPNWNPTTSPTMIVTSRTSSTASGQNISSGVLSSPDVYIWSRSSTNYIGAYITFKGVNTTQLLGGGTSELGTYFSFTSTGVTCTTTFDSNSYTYNDTFFKNIVGQFQTGSYTGDNSQARAITHYLGIAPDVICVIPRTGNGAKSWWQRGICYESANDKTTFTTSRKGTHLNLASNVALITSNGYFGDTSTSTNTSLVSQPTQFLVGTSNNSTGINYEWFAFCRVPGVCNIGTYIGSAGSSRDLFHGFSAGVRFIMIKAISTSGEWWTWDTTRGLTSASATFDDHQAWSRIDQVASSDDLINNSSRTITINGNVTTALNGSGTVYLWVAFAL
jgi:hypothetical protein